MSNCPSASFPRSGPEEDILFFGLFVVCLESGLQLLAGSYQSFREGIGVVGGQELPDLPPFSLPVQPVGLLQVLTVLLSGWEGIGTAQFFWPGLMLFQGRLASLLCSCSRTLFRPLEPPQGSLQGLLAQGHSRLPRPGVRRRGPPVIPATLPRRSLVGRLGSALRGGHI